jgi:polysaccharide export outer membrane protein
VAGQIHAEGLTTQQLRAKLAERFAKELLHPEVSVEIVDFGSQPVSVMGAVNRPGIHQLHGHKTLGEVLALAEGLRPDAGSRITITREIGNGQIPLATAALDPTGEFSVAAVNVRQLLAGEKPADNIQIYPHDLITVPTAEMVYVVGEVKKPGEVLLKDRDTISALQALAGAEGFGPTPAPQNAKIMRLVPGQPGRAEISVDLRKVQEGRAEDIAMRPNDILVVPPSGPKKAALRATEAAIQAVTGIIIWRRP